MVVFYVEQVLEVFGIKTIMFEKVINKWRRQVERVVKTESHKEKADCLCESIYILIWLDSEKNILTLFTFMFGYECMHIPVSVCVCTPRGACI